MNVNHLHYTPGTDEVGVFKGTVKPVRNGPYKRITKSGNIVWSYFINGDWGMFGSNKARAIQRKNKPSKQQSLPWIGRAKA